jgi:hypothetical protein
MSLNEGLLFSNFGPYYLLDLNTFESKALVNRDFQNLLNSKIFPSAHRNKGKRIYFANFQTGKIDSVSYEQSYFQLKGE